MMVLDIRIARVVQVEFQTYHICYANLVGLALRTNKLREIDKLRMSCQRHFRSGMQDNTLQARKNAPYEVDVLAQTATK